MLISDTPELTQGGGVEVSGWDEDQFFFVERSELCGDEFDGKRITLKRRLSEGSIIFVRPIQHVTVERTIPIPYEAEFAGYSPEGYHQFRLNSVQPRHGRGRYAVN